MIYPVKMTAADRNEWLVTFPDLPEAVTSGATKEEALGMANDALITAIDFYLEYKREIPTPTKVKKGQPSISLSAVQSAKVLLLNEMIRQKIGPTAVARKMGISPQCFNRVKNLRHNTNLDQIENALKVLGKRLVLSLSV